MAQEIELKLSIATEHIHTLKRHPLLQQLSSAPPRSRTLFNIYFDTPALDLQRHRVALRIRETQGRYIQTLKTQGRSVGGLHQRGEWEWELPAPQLQLALLPDDAWPPALRQQTELARQLGEVFRTDFVRTTWQLSVPDTPQQPGACIELALDQGTVSAGKRHDTICEIELELKSGAPTQLFQVARTLARTIPLQLSNISKAQRGLRLVAPERTQPAPQPPQLTAEHSLAEAFDALMHYEMACWQHQQEAFDFTGEWLHLQQLQCAVTSLRTNLLLFARLLPRSQTRALRDALKWFSRQLQALLTAWRTNQALAHYRAAEDPSLNQAALTLTDYPQLRQRYQQLRQDHRVGQLALALAEQLYRRDWLHNSAERAGAESFAEAGATLMTQLWHGLHLPRQPMHKQAWRQQLPRLRRFVRSLSYLQGLYERDQLQPLTQAAETLLEQIERLDGHLQAEQRIRAAANSGAPETTEALLRCNQAAQRELLFELGRHAQALSARALRWH